MDWPPDQPCLSTGRLELRPLELEHAGALYRLVNDPAIAATTLLIPHPYPEGAAEEFILGQESAWVEHRGVTFGIFQKAGGPLLGCTGLGYDREHERAEMGYWIGRKYWNCGYATEAARYVVAFGFAHFRLRRIEARHFVSNPASGRVLEKIGMQREEVRPKAIFKEGRGWEDVVEYSLSIGEWRRRLTERA